MCVCGCVWVVWLSVCDSVRIESVCVCICACNVRAFAYLHLSVCLIVYCVCASVLEHKCTVLCTFVNSVCVCVCQYVVNMWEAFCVERFACSHVWVCESLAFVWVCAFVLSVRYVCVVRASGCLSERVMCPWFVSVSSARKSVKKQSLGILIAFTKLALRLYVKSDRFQSHPAKQKRKTQNKRRQL